MSYRIEYPRLRSGRSGKMLSMVLFLLVLLLAFAAVKLSAIFVTRSKVEAIVSNLPTNLGERSQRDLREYFYNEFVRATGYDIAKQDIRVRKGRGTVEVSFRYRVPVNFYAFTYRHIVRQDETRAFVDGAVTTDGKAVRKQGGRFSEHTETYTIP